MSESYSYILKYIIVGPSNIGKTTFVKGYSNNSVFKDFDCPLSFGLNFAVTTIEISSNVRCKLMLWDIKSRTNNQFHTGSFYRGATGAILCFDVSNRASFEELPLWLNQVRQVNGYIPTILVGTKSDLPHAVTDDEIHEFVVDNHLDGFQLSSNRMSFKRDIILKLLTEIIVDESDNRIPDDEKALFYEFLRTFNKCPICFKDNHKSSLKKFFISKNPKEIGLKNRLLKLMKQSREFDDHYYNHIVLGVPCCSCFKVLFND